MTKQRPAVLTFGIPIPEWVQHRSPAMIDPHMEFPEHIAGTAYGEILSANYVKHYAYLDITDASWHHAPGIWGIEGRYILPFVITAKGEVTASTGDQKINGHVPWPNNSPFLQMIEGYSQLNQIDLSDIDIFIELGTATAQTAIAMSAFFKVITVECQREVFEENIGKKGIHHPVEFHHGHGPAELGRLLINNPDERLLILLDDHDSSLNAFIEEELITIKRLSNRNDHIIIIDDLDHVGQGTYPHDIGVVEALCRNINKDYIVSLVEMENILPGSRGTYLVYPPIEKKEEIG